MKLLFAVTIAAMIQPGHQSDKWWPPDLVTGCQSVCRLSGNGGILSSWLDWVDSHRKATFVVYGTCASACYHAVNRARTNGSKVIIKPGTRLIPHEPSKARWK